jgi:putative ABC transport system permease protein
MFTSMFTSMFTHYLWLGLKSLRRNPGLTALTVLILAIGIAASMTSLTVLYVMSSDPLPGQSQRLYVPQFNNGLLSDTNAGDEPNPQMTWLDADQLLKDGQGTRRTVLYRVSMTVTPPRPDIDPFFGGGMAVTADFFPMFQAPMASGTAWSAADDEQGAEVVVLSAPTARRLFGAEEALGRSVQLDGRSFRIVGVLADWQPVPKIYRMLGSGVLSEVEPFFMPLRTAIAMELPNAGWVNCTGTQEPGWANFLRAECNWLQYWVEVEPADLPAYRDYLRNHVAEQRRLGRLLRSENYVLSDAREWMAARGVVSNDTRLQAGLALAFFAACLVNVVGLLAAKFAARAAEIGVRRALGASRRQVFMQFLVESGVIGVAGAGLGLLLSFAGLALVARRGDGMERVAQMDTTLLVTTVVLAMVGTLLAGLWPTWRAAAVRPALQLKSQ